MTATVFKCRLEVVDEQVLYLPVGAKILSVAQQGPPRPLMLWALVDTDVDQEPRVIRIYGTGHPIETPEGKGLNFITTAVTMNGELVWHIFEVVDA